MVASIFATQQPAFANPERSLRPSIVPIGDSRVPWVLDPATQRQKGATDFSNVACALAEQKYTTPGGFGISGADVPTYLANLNAAIALNPGVIFIPSVLNSLAANVTGATIAGQIMAAANTAIAAGILVVVGSEVGSTVLTAPQITEMDAYNALMKANAAATKGLEFLDFRPALCTAPTGGVIQAQYRYDPGHFNQLGARVGGAILDNFLRPKMPANAGFILGANGLPLVGGYTQLALNPRFATTTGGSTSTGATGTFAGSCTFNLTGAGAALAVTSALENVVMDCTFAAQGNNCRFATTASNAAWNSGDIVRGMLLVELAAGAVNLAGIELNLVANGDSVSTTWSDLATNVAWAGPNDAVRMLLLTQEYAIPAYTAKGSLSASCQIRAFGAGSARITAKQVGILKKA